MINNKYTIEKYLVEAILVQYMSVVIIIKIL